MSKIIKLMLLGTGLLLAFLMIVPLAMADLSNFRQDISQTQTDAGLPAVAVSPDGKKIGIVWVDRYQGGEALQGPIYFRAGDRDNAQFSQRTAVDFAASASDQSTAPDIASDPSGKMHIVWRNLQDDGTRIYYATCNVTIPTTADQADCDDDAAHIEIDQAESPLEGDTVNTPAVAANLDSITGIHVVWNVHDAGSSSDSIYYRGRGTGSFSSKTSVGNGTQPALVTAISGGHNYVHLVWVDGSQVKYARGDDMNNDGVVDNSSWATNIKNLPAPSGTTSNPGYPTVAAVTNTVVVMWEVFPGNQAAYDSSDIDEYYAVMAVSYDNGANFNALGANAVNIKSLDTTYHLRRSDNSTSQSDDDPNSVRSTIHARGLQLSAAMDPTPGVVSPTVHLVWHQSHDPAPPENLHHDIFYSKYREVFGAYAWNPDDPNPGASNFYARDFRDNETDGVDDPGKAINNTAYSTAPDIAVGPDGEVHIVYMEGSVAGGGSSGFRVDDTQFNVYYNNNFGVNMNTPAVVDDGVYLPIVLKNS